MFKIQGEKYLTTNEAAVALGVSCSSIREYERKGLLPATRNPLNSYRLFNQRDVQAVINTIRAGFGEEKDKVGEVIEQ